MQHYFMDVLLDDSVQVELTAWGDWTATCSASWLHVSTTSGTQSTTIGISADANPGLSSRTATVTFSNGVTPDRVCIVSQSGLRGNALAFDGSDDYVIAPQPVGIISNAFSISTWVKWQPSSPSEIDFICANQYEQMEIHTGATDNNLRFIPATGVYLDAGPVLPVSTWVHIVCSYSSEPAGAHLWVNGVEQTLVNNGPNPIGTAPTANLGSLYLGRRAQNAYYFQGSVDEFSVWNTVLSAAQVQALLIAPPDLDSSGLLQYYSFNHGIPGADNPGVTQLEDHKSSLNGTLCNFSLLGNISNWVASAAMLPNTLSAPELSISNDAVLSWNPVPGADYYEVYRSSNAEGLFLPIANTYNTFLQIDVTDLERAFYKVKAVAGSSRKNSR